MKKDSVALADAAGLRLDGRTIVLGIIGDPIAQVKAPLPLTTLLQARGLNAILVPLHVQTADVDRLLTAFGTLRNFAGFIVTVPHKQRVARSLSAHLSPAAQRANAANVVRRSADGTWEADLLDGTGFVTGLTRAGFDPRGTTARIVGAGGAASAIAFALSEAGSAHIGIHDVDAERRDQLLAQLRAHGIDAFCWNGLDTRNARLLVNATPLGMHANDPLPLPADALHDGLWVADVIMSPAVTPLLEVAAARGCRIHEGRHMMEQQLELMADFFAPAIESVEATGRERP